MSPTVIVRHGVSPGKAKPGVEDPNPLSSPSFGKAIVYNPSSVASLICEAQYLLLTPVSEINAQLSPIWKRHGKVYPSPYCEVVEIGASALYSSS